MERNPKIEQKGESMLPGLSAIILKAGREIRSIQNLTATSKGAVGDFVTEADRKSEEVIVRGLGEKFPKCAIFTEETESAITRENYKDCELLFVVDPIDGTANYMFGIPHSAISIGVFRYGQPFGGIIYDLCRGDLYEVEVEKGILVNGARLAKPKISELEQAVIGSSWPYGETPRKNLELWERMVGKVAGLRVMGSAVMDFVYAATGRFTCYFSNSLKPYDNAVGFMMLREAGHKVTDWQGREAEIFDPDIVSAPAELYDEFYRLLFGERGEPVLFDKPSEK